MKLLVFVFLGLCVFTANAQDNFDIPEIENFNFENFEAIDKDGQRNVLSYLTEFVDYLKTHAEKVIKFIQDKVKNITNEVIEEIQTFAEEKFLALNKLVEEGKLEFGQKSNNAIACFDKYRPAITDLLEITKERIGPIILNTFGEIYEITKVLEPYTNLISVEIGKLQEIMKKCIRPLNPISTFKCLIKSVEDIKNSLKTVIKNAVEALKMTVQKLRELTQQTKSEIDKIINETETEIKKIFDEIRECLKGGPGGQEKPEEPSSSGSSSEKSDESLNPEETSENLKILAKYLY